MTRFSILLLSLMLCLHGCTSNEAIKEVKTRAKVPAGNDSEANKYIDKTVINFDTDSFVINEEQKERLARLLGKLAKSDTNYLIKVTGFTDDIGDDEYNNKLANSRANIIRDYLISNLVPSSYIATEASGKCCYLNANEDEEQRYENRRAEIMFMNEFFVVDYNKNNLQNIMETLSQNYGDRQFILFTNTNDATEWQDQLVSRTRQSMRMNILNIKSEERASLNYSSQQVVIGLYGSHKLLADELPMMQIFGNAEQEVSTERNKFVIRDKRLRSVPRRRTEEELRLFRQESERTQIDSGIMTSNQDYSILNKRIKANLNIDINEKILRTIDEEN